MTEFLQIMKSRPHRVASQAFAYRLFDDVLPKLAGHPNGEQILMLAAEVEKFLEMYQGALEERCAHLQDLLNDALSCTIKPQVVRTER